MEAELCLIHAGFLVFDPEDGGYILHQTTRRYIPDDTELFSVPYVYNFYVFALL
jgi:hypothetical protein